MITVPDVTFREVERPAADAPAHDPSMRDLEAIAALRSAHWRRILGTDDLAETAEQLRISWTRPSSWQQRYWVAEERVAEERVAEDGGAERSRIVGFAAASLDLRDDLEGGVVDVVVDEERRQRGIGASLSGRATDALASSGRTRFESWVVHEPEGPSGARIASPTGHGSVPADDHAAAFCTAFGLELAQVVRISALDFDAEGALAARLERLRAEALDAAGPDYRVRSWVAPSPDEALDDLAALAGRMSTDEPKGEREVVAATFDAERVRRNESRAIEAGRPQRYAVVEHVPSGRIVAHNVLTVDLARPERRAHQDDTLVLPEHRGRRLGWLVKCEGLLRLREDHPECPGVITWNAEENRPMLAVNEQLGFRPLGVEGAWRGTLLPRLAGIEAAGVFRAAPPARQGGGRGHA